VWLGWPGKTQSKTLLKRRCFDFFIKKKNWSERPGQNPEHEPWTEPGLKTMVLTLCFQLSKKLRKMAWYIRVQSIFIYLIIFDLSLKYYCVFNLFFIRSNKKIYIYNMTHNITKFIFYISQILLLKTNLKQRKC
jgi:hypothetical protein